MRAAAPLVIIAMLGGVAAAQTEVAPAVVSLPTAPGSVRGLAGAAEVGGFDGQLAFSVPIAVPAVGRLRPSLALGYSGGLGNGPLGLGWSLSAPMIRRATDHGVPTYDDGDELILEGLAGSGRLVPLGDGRYAVEGQGSSWRVTRIGGRFEVTDPDGVRWIFGSHVGARLRDGTRVAAWLAETAIDTAGDQLELDYATLDGVPYLERVTWADGAASIELVWEARPDPVVSFATGFRVLTSRRLGEVRVTTGGERASTYSLDYDETSSLSRLAVVHATGRNGNDAWPSQRFGYGTPPAAWTQRLDGVDGWTLGTRGTAAHDVDGDGVVDLLRLEMGNHGWRPAQLGGGFGAVRAITGADAVALETSRLIDLDGDAIAELVRIVDDSWRAYRLDGARWRPLGAIAGSEGIALGDTLVDVDGDGRVDVLTATTGGLSVRMGGEAGFAAPVARPPISIGDVAVEPGAPNVRFVDHNGDGLIDALWLTDGWLRVFLGRGDGTFESLTRVFWPWGDGGFDPANVHLVDLDRDGLIDVARVTAGHVLWWKGLGDHRFSDDARHVTRPEAAEADVSIGFGDTDGDGAAELLWSSPRGLWALHLAAPASAGMLATIDNGLGLTTHISYAGTGRLTLAAAAVGAPWAQRLPAAMAVATQITRVFADGTPTRVTRWSVRDGFWDGAERRVGGFLETRVEARGDGPRDTEVRVTRFLIGAGDDRALRGQPWHERVEDGEGRVLEVATTTWRAAGTLPPRARPAAMVEHRVAHREAVTTPIETLVEVTVDDEGRPLVERDHGRLDLAGDERVARQTYADDEPRNVRGRVVELAVENGDGEVVSTSRFRYGGPGTELEPLGSVGRGWPRQTLGLLEEDTGSRWVLLDEQRYDTNGNVVEQYGNGIRHFIAYDPAGMFPVREAIWPRPDVELVWQLTWDATLGVPVALTDPSGDSTHVGHDGLGRVVTISVGDRPPHQRVEYHWDSPRSETRSFAFDGPAADLGAAGPWRESVAVSNGAGEEVCAAVRLGNERWAVSGFTVRDQRGRVVETAEPFVWNGAAIPAEASVSVPRSTVRYDAFGRAVEVVDPEGRRTAQAYQAFVSTVTAGDRAPVTTTTDGAGQVIRTERTVDGRHELVEGEHDPEGRLTRQLLAGGAAWQTFTYDSLGRMVFGDDSDGGERRTTFDDAGRTRRQVNATGQVIELDYDDAGRLVERRLDGVATTYGYDDASRRALGRLATVTEPIARLALRYNSEGRVVEHARTIDGVTATETIDYQASGLVRSRRFDDGLVLPYTHDRAGRLTRIGDYWEALELDAAGRVRLERAGNGLETTFDHDRSGQTSSVQVGGLYHVDLRRDAAGALSSITDLDGTGVDHSATFTHDGAGRLVEAVQGEYRFTYAYDRLENLIERTAEGPRTLDIYVGSYQYGQDGAGPRQLTSAGGVSLGYDAAGRQQAEGDRTITYDALDQVTRVDAPGGALGIDYDFNGQRIRSTLPDGSVERWFASDLREREGGREHYVAVGDRTVAKVKLRPPGAPMPAPGGGVLRRVPWAPVLLLLAALYSLAVPRRRRRAALHSTLAFALLTGHLGCTTFGQTSQPAWDVVEVTYLHASAGVGPGLITGATGAVIEDRRFEPFGAEIDPAATTEALGNLNKPIDETTGWSYHGARWMSPRTARWLSVDPLARTPRALSIVENNAYEYARSNPIDLWDPDGTTAESDMSIDRRSGEFRPPAGTHMTASQLFETVVIGGPCVLLGCNPANAPKDANDIYASKTFTEEFVGYTAYALGSLGSKWLAGRGTSAAGGIGGAPSGAGGSAPAAAARAGVLRSTGAGTWESAAGLVYGQGSKQGNRVLHVLEHAADIPTRAGQHGVFAGGRTGVIGAIDDAYRLAMAGGPGVMVATQGTRTVYRVPMQGVGWVGGKGGAAMGNPAATHVRLVLEGRNVISGFPEKIP